MEIRNEFSALDLSLASADRSETVAAPAADSEITPKVDPDEVCTKCCGHCGEIYAVYRSEYFRRSPCCNYRPGD